MRKISVEGKTVKELEKYLIAGKINGNKDFKDLFSQWRFWLLVLLLGVIIYLVYAHWNVRQESKILYSELSQLKVENTTLKERIAAAEMARAGEQASPQAPQTDPSPYIYHTIQKGDSFAVISNRYYRTEVFASDLAKFNGIPKQTRLQVGQIIRVPKEPDPAWKK
ncbi:LysM domain-containing protein [Desulforamulus ruminis]|uniref:Peptidoglycan-binding lysin domain protein n=1 Tax=Desulforamulus ruminis (strain ATCC 23193 / DSM 2154 / NCIMB 8452 / DL) TaxID=696281 RepID=F6DNV2_DESRL|nr:LysM domain-containing protein [Desulforamulus ruminis]AEG59547.1 Peptidoglycan-binding lysin domain protein [Desulforamulus ruminis DSM 2154]